MPLSANIFYVEISSFPLFVGDRNFQSGAYTCLDTKSNHRFNRVRFDQGNNCSIFDKKGKLYVTKKKRFFLAPTHLLGAKCQRSYLTPTHLLGAYAPAWCSVPTLLPHADAPAWRQRTRFTPTHLFGPHALPNAPAWL